MQQSNAQEQAGRGWSLADLLKKEDWWTVWLGFLIILGAVAGLFGRPVVPKVWGASGTASVLSSVPADIWFGIFVTGILTMVIFSVSVYFTKRSELKGFLLGFPAVFLLAVGAYVIGGYAPWRHYGFNDVIWALVIGLVISNIFGVPKFLKAAIRTELYIKTGLVLLGATILFNRILTLGAAGLGVAWIVTPLVLVFMYWYSQRYLKMQEDRGLAITLVSALSVCGVSAAIASGTAAKAKKEEISLAISITLIFTVIMMIGMPFLVRTLNIDPAVGGAWLGGTIDATGAVVASAAMLGEDARDIASIVKMIQNILIGLIAFGIAVFWTVVYEKRSVKEANVSPKEIWVRLPKFILGFVAASLLFSFVLPKSVVDNTLPVISGFSGFFFTLAFISIGLESNFKVLGKMVRSGKPLTLYLIGQTLNIVLTLIAAYVFFSGNIFPRPF